ncbi:hypothetical protein MTO96_052366 [Rhipicephalus appendiculatus]
MCYRLEPHLCLRLLPIVFYDEYFGATTATSVPVVTWTPRHSMGAMDRVFQDLHDCFGRLRPTCHSSEGDPAELLGLGRTTDFPDSKTTDNPCLVAASAAGRALTSPSPGELDRAIATLEGHFKCTVNVTAAWHRCRRRTQAPGETAAEYVTALRSLVGA